MTQHSSARLIMSLQLGAGSLRRASVVLSLAVVASQPAHAQHKQQYSSLGEALQSPAILAGRGEPQNVVWLDGGSRFSFITRDPRTGRAAIRAYEPATGPDTLLFSAAGGRKSVV